MIPEYSEIPEVIRAEMRRLQKAAQGKVDESVFERNPPASKTSGGFDWPKERFEAWSKALSMGQFDALLKILEKPKRKYTKKAEKAEPKQANPEPEPKRKYTKKAEKAEPKQANPEPEPKRKYTKKAEAEPKQANPEPEPKRKYTKKAEAEPIEGAAAPTPADLAPLLEMHRTAALAALSEILKVEERRRFEAARWIETEPAQTKKAEPKQTKKAEPTQPEYYKQLKGGDVLDMMLAVYGKEAVKNFCELNAFKYRMRAGRKSTETVESDISKALFYEEKAKELCGAEK